MGAIATAQITTLDRQRDHISNHVHSRHTHKIRNYHYCQGIVSRVSISFEIVAISSYFIL